MPVLYGVFLYMGVASLNGIQVRTLRSLGPQSTGEETGSELKTQITLIPMSISLPLSAKASCTEENILLFTMIYQIACVAFKLHFP